MLRIRITKTPRRRRRSTEIPPLPVAAHDSDIARADALLDRIDQVLEVA